MEGSKPNLFVIGAAKSGTTSLHHYLARHPDVFMSEPKEPGFFVDELDYYPSDEEWYLNLFEEGATARYRGESSTHYTKLPVYSGVPERIARYCNEPRFIYLMRDPVDRAISQYWHNSRKNQEFRSPLKAMRVDRTYKAYGEYARQLRPYIDVFGMDRIFATTFECLIDEPDVVTTDILHWLGLDPGRIGDDFPTRNSSPDTLTQSLLNQPIGEFIYQSRAWDAISPIVPKTLKRCVKKFTDREVAPADFPMDEVVGFLRPWARDAAKDTEQLLQRRFPEWTLTFGDRPQ